MMITFAQYSILSAAYQCETGSELARHTRFDRTMVDYYLVDLVKNGLLSSTHTGYADEMRYQLTHTGTRSINEYERANPDLVIKKVRF